MFVLLERCCVARRVATSEWIMILSCVCRHRRPRHQTPANIQIHRDSGNCLIGLGALLRRIKQSQGMSRSWGRQHSTAQTNHCQSLKPRPLRLVFPHTVHIFWYSAKLQRILSVAHFSKNAITIQVGLAQAVKSGRHSHSCADCRVGIGRLTLKFGGTYGSILPGLGTFLFTCIHL